MRKYLSIMFFMLSTNAVAYEVSSFVKINQIRPIGGGIIYLHLSAPAICGATVLSINGKTEDGKKMYSAMLTAAAANKKVKFETWGVCAANGGWGTEIGGAYVKFN